MRTQAKWDRRTDVQHKEILATIENILMGQKTPIEQDSNQANNKHNHKRKLDIQEEDNE